MYLLKLCFKKLTYIFPLRLTMNFKTHVSRRELWCVQPFFVYPNGIFLNMSFWGSKLPPNSYKGAFKSFHWWIRTYLTIFLHFPILASSQLALITLILHCSVPTAPSKCPSSGPSTQFPGSVLAFLFSFILGWNWLLLTVSPGLTLICFGFSLAIYPTLCQRQQ